MKGDHKFRKRPKGAKGGGYARARHQIGFDDKTRKVITARAKENGRSFAAEVRTLVDIGLQTVADPPTDNSLTDPSGMGNPE